MPPRHIVLENERPTAPKPTMVFDLRRHLQPTASKNLEKQVQEILNRHTSSLRDSLRFDHDICDADLRREHEKDIFYVEELSSLFD